MLSVYGILRKHRWATYFSCICLFWLIFAILNYQVHNLVIVIKTDKTIHRTKDTFLSLALDTALLHNGWIHKHIRSERLRKVTAELAPGYLRIGGTLADCLLFDSEDNLNKTTHLSKNFTNFIMTGQDWIMLNNFAHDTGFNLLFDLNVLLRKDYHWDSTNAMQLLNFTEQQGFNLSWQLGNEPNAFRHVFGVTVPGNLLGEDFVTLRRLLDSYSLQSKSKLIGPDVTRPKFPQVDPISYLKDFLEQAHTSIDAVSFHQYYLNGREATIDDFLNPNTLDILHKQIESVQEVTVPYDLPIWLSETSSAFGGGAPGLSDRYVAGFLWLDKLGLAARSGIDVVIRQSLYRSHYGLLDKDTYTPLPDWWLSVLYKRLVGSEVLDVAGSNNMVRLYSHCAFNSSGNVVLFGINLHQHKKIEFSVSFHPLASSQAKLKRYTLTADSSLTSKSILLNGKKLQLDSEGSVPMFEPEITNSDEEQFLPPLGMGFWVTENLSISLCQ